MKTTYLIYKQIDGERQLAVATWEEWTIILKANKGLPMSERRLFEKNCFEDEGELDCMFIEVDREAYDEWHRRNEAYRYRHKDDANFDVRSLDEPIENSEVESLHEAISSGVSVADVSMDDVGMIELRKKLRAWKPWAEDLLDYYLKDKKRSCTAEMARKYNVSAQKVREYKRKFES